MATVFGPERVSAPPAEHRRGGTRASWLPTVVAGALLLATFTSRVEVLAVAATVLALAIAGARLVVRGRLDRIGWAALLYLGYLLVLAAVVGSLPAPSQLAGFAAFDGRAFVAFAPLLVYATLDTGPADVRRLRTMLRISAVAGVVLLAAALAGVAPELLSRGNFHGLTSSHHVVGLYFGVVAVALALAPDPTRGSLDRTLAVASAGIVVASGSRTALVGLLVAGLYAASTAPTLGRRLRNLVVTAMVVVLSLALSGRVLTTAQFLVSDDFISAAAHEFSEPDSVETGKRLDSVGSRETALANVLIRFGVWRAGLDEFARSPVVGIGSFRLNDPDRSYVGPRGVVNLATEGTVVHGAGFGAHNLVIQTLAETGVVGLLLLARPWLLIRRRLRAVRSRVPEARAGVALLAFAVGTTLTSNSLVSPALVFPLGVCCMTWARHRPRPSPRPPR